MQVNSAHLAPLHLALEELFDPCQNVRIGTTILSDFYRQHQTGDPAHSLFAALSAYNTGRAWKGADYVNRILASAGAAYRVSFVPGPARKIGRSAANTDSTAAPAFFSNTSTALMARKGMN